MPETPRAIAPCTEDGRRHYEVMSPMMTRGGWIGGYEPPEDFCAWAVVLAPNASVAKWSALGESTFCEWATQQRGDNKHPLAGLTAKRALCEHGVCWGCTYPDTIADGCDCNECQAEWESFLKKEAEADA